MTAATISKSRKGASQHTSRSKCASKPIQLPLFKTVVTDVRTEPVLIIESVTPSTAQKADSTLSITVKPLGIRGIEPGRFQIVVREYDLTWHFPIQWKSEELDTVQRIIQQFDWSLSFEDGTPLQIESIYAAFEQLLGSGNDYAQSYGEVR